MSEKRQDYISWDEYFMGVAKLAGLAEFRHADKLLHRKLCRSAFVLIEASGNTVLDP